MALLKTIKIGEELIFDLSNKSEGAKNISIILVENAGGRSFLKIFADRSIPIHHVRKISIPDPQGNGDHSKYKRGGAKNGQEMRSLYD